MKQIYIFFLFIFFLLFESAYSQMNTDSIFARAIFSARNKQYDHAISEAHKAILSDPYRADIMVYIANVYSWQEKNDSALLYIRKAQSLNYFKEDLFDAWLNILLRTQQFDALLECCQLAEQNAYTNAENILQKRLIAYAGLKKYDEGISLVKESVNSNYLQSGIIADLYTNLLLKRNTHVVSAYYTVDLFDIATPQHLANVGYSFGLNEHTMLLRMNYANKFQLTDIQVESDFYFQLKYKQYLYFNYGYAINAFLFPRHRAGFEYYFPLKYKAEASIGGRYMYYSNSQVVIASGHLGKYLGKHWLALRPFYVFQKNIQSLSLIADYRIYGKNELDFWGVEMGYGNSPDDRFATTQNAAFSQLHAYKLKIEKNFMLNRVSDIRIGMGYAREEFITSQFRNRYTVELGYKLRLK